jgi:hypothetical protein
MTHDFKVLKAGIKFNFVQVTYGGKDASYWQMAFVLSATERNKGTKFFKKSAKDFFEMSVRYCTEKANSVHIFAELHSTSVLCGNISISTAN